MDSSMENALLEETLKELGTDGLIKAMADARAASDRELIDYLLKERQRKQQQEHSRRPHVQK